MLIEFVISSVFDERQLVLSVGHVILVLVLIEQTNLDNSISLALLSECVRVYRVLEVLASMLQLICLRKDHAELVEHFRLLVELRAHFQHGDQGRDGVIIAFELLIQYANAVPQLTVLDVSERVQGSLVSLEGVLQVLDEQVAVTESCPGGTIDGVNRDYLEEVLDGTLVVTVGSAALGKTVDTLNLQR